MTAFMTKKVQNKSRVEREEIFQEVAASLLLGMGNVIGVSSYSSSQLVSRDSTRAKRDLKNEDVKDKVEQLSTALPVKKTPS